MLVNKQTTVEASQVQAKPNVQPQAVAGPIMEPGMPRLQTAKPGRLTPQEVLQLQRTIGNQATQRLIARSRPNFRQQPPQNSQADPGLVSRAVIQREPGSSDEEESEESGPGPKIPQIPQNDNSGVGGTPPLTPMPQIPPIPMPQLPPTPIPQNVGPQIAMPQIPQIPIPQNIGPTNPQPVKARNFNRSEYPTRNNINRPQKVVTDKEGPSALEQPWDSLGGAVTLVNKSLYNEAEQKQEAKWKKQAAKSHIHYQENLAKGLGYSVAPGPIVVKPTKTAAQETEKDEKNIKKVGKVGDGASQGSTTSLVVGQGLNAGGVNDAGKHINGEVGGSLGETGAVLSFITNVANIPGYIKVLRKPDDKAQRDLALYNLYTFGKDSFLDLITMARQALNIANNSGAADAAAGLPIVGIIFNSMNLLAEFDRVKTLFEALKGIHNKKNRATKDSAILAAIKGLKQTLQKSFAACLTTIANYILKIVGDAVTLGGITGPLGQAIKGGGMASQALVEAASTTDGFREAHKANKYRKRFEKDPQNEENTRKLIQADPQIAVQILILKARHELEQAQQGTTKVATPALNTLRGFGIKEKHFASSNLNIRTLILEKTFESKDEAPKTLTQTTKEGFEDFKDFGEEFITKPGDLKDVEKVKNILNYKGKNNRNPNLWSTKRTFGKMNVLKIKQEMLLAFNRDLTTRRKEMNLTDAQVAKVQKLLKPRPEQGKASEKKVSFIGNFYG